MKGAEGHPNEGYPWKWVIFAGGLYLIGTMVVTYPWVLRWSHQVPGPPEDNFLGLWTLWWMRKALVELHQSPMWTDYLYWPCGTSLAFHTFSYYNALLSVPLQALFSRTETYNLLVFSSFPLSALGGFCLAYEVSKNSRGSFLAGWMVAFSGYHIAHSQHHLNLASIQWLPWYMWAMVRMSRSPSVKWGVIAGLFFVLSSLSSWYYAVFLFMWTFIWMLLEGRKGPVELQRSFAVCLCVGLIGILPFAIPMLYRLMTEPLHAFAEVNPLRHGGDLLGYIMPSFDHSILGKSGLVSQFYARMGPFPWESVVFLGILPLVLSIVGTVLRPRGQLRLWFLTFWVFWVFSLGPDLRLGGRALVGHLPYEWMIQRVPLLDMVRVPSRFVLMCIISLAVMASMGYAALEAKVLRTGRGILFSICILLLFVETVAFPIRMTDPMKITEASIFTGLRGDGHGEAVLELPMRGYVYNLIYMFRQTVHEKRLVFGAMSRISDEAIKWIREGPLLQFALPQKPIEAKLVRELVGELVHKGVGYVVINENFFRFQGPRGVRRLQELKRALQGIPQASLYKQDRDTVIYRIKLPYEGA